MNEKAPCEMRAYLAFYGGFAPAQMLELFSCGAPHIEMYHQGDTRRFSEKAVAVNTLEVGTTMRETYDLEALLDELHALGLDWQEINRKAVTWKLDVYLHVVASFGCVAPAIILAPQHLRWLADLGATVDMDLYPGSHTR